ncbi:hypothetical protein BHE90_008559 [Fusarium euwallaceae]|uniref:Peptidase C14 caspase domain-containing protein n=1 Tax=Fusarium euwallaceae TaxID=1147111 RepID=A0A430LMM8_9HYPO|nr:hypothetical protein BHE90_008559 [Fusarium euwallaceae]
MSFAKRALLIASPFGNLVGPEDDVQRMAEFLEADGFQIERCCGSHATRDGIRAAWNRLIGEISREDDVVVIYYSGHGGEVISGDFAERQQQQYRHHFIVPMDFSSEDFRGILDVELSSLLWKTTEATHNVTIVLDCCHSGRMARDPHHGSKAIPKSIPKVRLDMVEHIECLRREGHVPETRILADNNPHIVRISAAASSETAWEYENATGQRVGALTEALVDSLKASGGQALPWRTIMLRAKELVNVKFPQQHPQADGQHNRLPFSLKKEDSTEHVIKIDLDGIPKIQAGRVVGIREDSTYTVMPFGSRPSDTSREIAEATVAHVSGFRSTVSLEFKNGESFLPVDGALAFPRSLALYRWPAELPEGDHVAPLREKLLKSRFLRLWNEEGDDSDKISSTPLVRFQQQDGLITLWNDRGVQIASHSFQGESPQPSTVNAAIKSSEMLARAQHFLALKSERQPREKLSHKLRVELGVVDVNKNNHSEHWGRVIKQDGSDVVEEDSLIYIDLHNSDKKARVFVSVFNVEINGEISLLSTTCVAGIELVPDEHYTLGQWHGVLQGLRISWPDGVPKDQPVTEMVVVVVSDAEADLTYLESSRPEVPAEGRGDYQLSSLQSLTYALSYGGKRKIQAETVDVDIHYDIMYIPFLLQSPSTQLPGTSHSPSEDDTGSEQTPTADLPEPEATAEWKSLASLPDSASQAEPEPKGFLDAVVHAIKGIPPCVWVVNRHTEEITVVVSKLRPNRILSAVGVGGSLTGGAVDVSTTTYHTPAVMKILAPHRQDGGGDDDKASMACFPFWSRSDGFGVITIFVGSQKTLYIENDKVRTGVTAYFENKPDLRIVEYGS